MSSNRYSTRKVKGLWRIWDDNKQEWCFYGRDITDRNGHVIYRKGTLIQKMLESDAQDECDQLNEEESTKEL